MQATLAKLLGLPFIFVTHSNAIIHGSDGAVKTFEKLFPRNELGVVNHKYKEFDRLGTITTYASFTNQKTLSPVITERVKTV